MAGAVGGPPALLVIMGVSGSGKSTVGALLGQQEGWTFVDGDALHPQANVDKMSAGQPLTDEDRKPWLEAINGVLTGWCEAETQGAVACSSLKRTYRELLGRGLAGRVRFVYLRGSFDLIKGRMDERSGHFMKPEMLRSQFAALEEPGPEERVLRCEVSDPPAAIVARLLASLREPEPAPS